MSELQRIDTRGADELVVLSRADYDRLIERLEDAEDLAAAKAFDAALARGEEELLPWETVKRLRHEHPVAVWREHRGLTQRALAEKADMTAAQLSEIERGKKTGSVATLKRLATTLKLSLDDLVPPDL